MDTHTGTFHIGANKVGKSLYSPHPAKATCIQSSVTARIKGGKFLNGIKQIAELINAEVDDTLESVPIKLEVHK